MRKSNSLQALRILIAGISLCLLIPSVLTGCKEEKQAEANSDGVIDDSTILLNDSDTLHLDTEVPLEMSFTSIPEPTFSDGKYSIQVHVDNVPAGAKVTYQICEPFGDKKVIASSEDGNFTELPYSEHEGTYAVVAIAQKDGKQVAKAEDVIIGFIKQEAVKRKMTVQELQKMVDKQDESLLGAGENAYLAPNVKLSFKGLDSDDAEPELMGDVLNNLKMRVWSKAKVIDIKHDSINRINEIHFQISY